MNDIKNMSNKQRGSSLLTVLVVLLVLSLLAVASFDSSNLQSLMTRNSQLRLETFNTANTEIEAQLDDFSSTAGVINATIAGLLDTESVTETEILSPKAAIPQTSVTSVNGFTKTVEVSKDGGCPIYGSQIDSGTGGTGCTSFIISSDATVDNLNIISDQSQTFNLLSL